MTTVLLTGANRGLGLATARRLLAGGADVIAAVREPRDPALAALRDAHPGRVRVVRCDLSALASVRAAVAEVAEGPPLHGLIANAGIQLRDSARAGADGYELTFATNVLGHHLLIRSLLDRMATPGRIVLVSSATHRGDFRHSGGMVPPPRWDDPAVLARPRPGSGKQAYTTSKLGVVHLTHELARRAPAGVDVYAFDPLLMPGTGLARDGALAERVLWHSVFHLTRLLPFAHSPAAAARHLAAAVLGPRPADSGAYLEMGRVVRSSPESYDPGREAELWRAAEHLTRTASSGAGR